MRRLPRLPFWLITSLALTLLFAGGESSIWARLEHNWTGSLILLAVGLFYHGRFGFRGGHGLDDERDDEGRPDPAPHLRWQRYALHLSHKTRITFRTLGAAIFALGMIVQIFAHAPIVSVSSALAMLYAVVAPVLLYFSYLGNDEASCGGSAAGSRQV